MSESDPNLKAVLDQWKIRESLPPRFQEGVWNRIERLEQSDSRVFPNMLWRWLDNAFAHRPTIAFAYIAVLALLGSGLGWTRAQSQKSQFDETMASRYVQSLDPYRHNHLEQ